MSLDTIDKIPRSTRELRDALQGASMPYGSALVIDEALVGVEALAALVKAEHEQEVRDLLAVVEGLLANWPHTEVVKHYTPTERPVLTKEEALKRASYLVKAWA